MEDKFNVLTSNNTKSVAYKYPNNIMDLYFDDKVFKTNSNWFKDNETFIQEDNYYYGDHGETNNCIDIILRIR